MGDRGAKDALFDGLAEVAKALASGRRAEIIDLLAQGERSVEEVASQIDQSVANTSHHLRALARAGLLTTRRDGTRIYYALSSEQVAALWAAMRGVAEAHVAGIERLADAYLGDRDGIEVIGRKELAAPRCAGARSGGRRLLPGAVLRLRGRGGAGAPKARLHGQPARRWLSGVATRRTTRDGRSMTAKLGLVLDCADPVRLADFWSAALGYVTLGAAGTYVLLIDEAGEQPKLLLQRVAEPKAGKNRMHFDIETPAVDDEVARLEGLGARRIEAEAIEEHGNRWVVMADPEGNEFCVCNAGASPS